MSTDASVRGQSGGAGHDYYAGDATKSESTKEGKAEGGKGAKGKGAKDSIGTVEKGDKELNLGGVSKKELGSKAAILNPNDLKELKPDDPFLVGDKNTSAPPAGAHGTGNPFFSPNPMVSFFISFQSMMQIMKEISMVAAKLSYMETLQIKETGKEQANAELEAGKAQYKADMTQAYLSIAMGALGAANAVVMARTFFRARGAINQQEKKLETDTNLAEKKALENENAVNKVETRLAGKQAVVRKNPLQEGEETKLNEMDIKKVKKQQIEDSEKTADVEEVAIEKQNLKKSKFETKQKVTEHETELKEEEVKEDTGEKNTLYSFNRQSSQSPTKKAKSQDDYTKEWTEKYNSHSNENDANQELDKSIASDQQKLKKLKKDQPKLDAKKEKANAELDAYKAGKAMHIGQAIQGDAWSMMWNAVAGPGGPLMMLLQAGQSIAKAQGELQTAYWKSYEQLCSMYLSIENKGADLAQQIGQDAAGQAKDLMAALKAASDNENNIRWSA